MGLALQVLGYAAAISLQLMIIHAMLHGAWRRYPFVFIYIIADLLTNLLEIKPNLAYDTGTAQAKRSWTFLYWLDERIIQALLFLLVISLIYRASTHVRPRRTLLLALVLGSLAFALASLAWHHNPNLTTGKWMTGWTRDMNFCAMILDLGLWAMLIQAREKDYRILMVSGALGIQFAGGAIGQALREMSHDTVPLTAVLIPAANLVCLYIWWQAFRKPVGSGKRVTA
jgi:hypothetical protein